MSLEKSGKILRKADPSTIQDKFLVGYQGWFTCAGDGEPVGPGHHGWLHWFNYPIPDGGRPNTDLWPDVQDYSPSELFPAPGLKTASGEQCFLFSSRNRKTVQRHFHWMARHGVDGAFLQRFAGQIDLEKPGNEGMFRIRDEVGSCVQEAAEKEGRVFSIMYDVSGVPADRIQGIIERDWTYLVRQKGLLDSPNYLRERGKAVVALWGFGFDGSGHLPATVRAITEFLRRMTPNGVYIVGGTPTHWRTSNQDADANPEFVDVWLNSFDAISPWSIGRYSNEEEADRFAQENMKGDVELIKRTNDNSAGTRKIEYIPVVFPGGSVGEPFKVYNDKMADCYGWQGCNLSEGKWEFNNIKRNGGRFLWQQVFNARRHGARVIYGAMWDEYDEGTAFMPVVPYKSQLPVHDRFRFLALDAEGMDLPSDWYMRICGFAVEGLRGERMIHETFPHKELQDYWSSRPRYDEKQRHDEPSQQAGSSQQASSSGHQLVVENPDEPPPPPYTLEDDTPSPAPQAVETPAVPQISVASMPPPTSEASRPDRNPSLSRHSSSSARPETRYVGNRLSNDMARLSLSPSTSPQPPPLPPRSTTPMYPPQSINPPRRASVPEPFGQPEFSLPTPTIPSFDSVYALPQSHSTHAPAQQNDPYAAWAQPQDQKQSTYGSSYSSPPPPPLRTRPTSRPSPEVLNTSYNGYPDRRRVQSSAAAFGPPSFHNTPNDMSFPQAFDSGGALPTANPSQGGSYAAYQQHVAMYGKQSPPLIEGGPSSLGRNSSIYAPPQQPQQQHIDRPGSAGRVSSSYTPYDPNRPTSPGRNSSTYFPYDQANRPLSGGPSSSNYAPFSTAQQQQSAYPSTYPSQSSNPPYPSGPPFRPGTTPNSSLSHSQSTSGNKKTTGGALNMAKGGVDMLLGKNTRKSVQTSLQSSVSSVQSSVSGVQTSVTGVFKPFMKR